MQYDHQDQAILAWLLASMTAGVLTQMVGMDTSTQVWEKLHTHYVSQTRAQINKHKQQLCTPKKDRSISAYLLDIKKIVDQLAAVGCPISTEDHIEAVLDGLSDEYDSFITSVTSRLDPYTVADIEALLLAQENRIERNKQFVDHILQANVASVPYSFSPPVLHILPPFSTPLVTSNNGSTLNPAFNHPKTSPRYLLLLPLLGLNVKFVQNMGTLPFTIGIGLILPLHLKLLQILLIFLHLLVMMNLRSSGPPTIFMIPFGTLIAVLPIISLLMAPIFPQQLLTQVRKRWL